MSSRVQRSVTETSSIGASVPDIPGNTSLWRDARRLAARFNRYDITAVALVTTVVAVALWTFKDYAVSNDEGVLVELENLHECSGSEIRMDARMENPLRRGGQFAL